MILTLLVVIGAVVLACLLHHGVTAYRIKAHIRAIRDGGLPASLDELTAWYLPAFTGDNAAPAYRKAFARLAELKDAGRPEGTVPAWLDGMKHLAAAA